MDLNSYKPIWPETVIFWGAGATRAINLRTTYEIANALADLAGKRDKKVSTFDRVSKVIKDPGMIELVVDLLQLIGDEPTSGKTDESVIQKHIGKITGFGRQIAEKRLRSLKYSYDWRTLRELIWICPGANTKSFQLQDLYNLIDMHILNGQGFYVYGTNQGGLLRFIPPEGLRPARNALVMITGLIHFVDYHLALKYNKKIINQYVSFADTLAELMQEEGLRLLEQGYSFEERSFYLFSYAVISMNWDPLLLWFIFNAHKRSNHIPKVKYVGAPPVEMRLFHDMGHFMGVRQVNSDSPSVWFPLNETVVQRLNQLKYQSSRRVRIGKFYFPHGCYGWRECPNCGKLTMHLGNEWSDDSPSLFPPQLLSFLNEPWHAPRSIEEKAAYNRGIFDYLQCAHCGTITELRHTPLIMQSSFKGNHPPFIEEIQRDMRIALEKARHVVLFGYTLPQDDFIYRSLLAARQKREGQEPFCTVIVGKDTNAPDSWLESDNLVHYLETLPDDNSFKRAIKSAQDIFGLDRVRGYARGIPDVFSDHTKNFASKEKVMELLYPRKEFPNNLISR